MYFFSGNSTNFAKVNIPKSNLNALTAKQAHAEKRQTSQNRQERFYYMKHIVAEIRKIVTILHMAQKKSLCI